MFPGERAGHHPAAEQEKGVMPPELILDARLELGEGPAWDAEAGVLHFVDIHAGDLHSFSPVRKYSAREHIGKPIGCMTPCKTDWVSPGLFQGDTILALKDGFALVNHLCGELEYILHPEPHLPGNRFNDGKCDPRGRFLAGTMDDAEQAASGSLYSYSPDGTLKTLLTGLRISNGLTWSPDGGTFYFIDTPTRTVVAYDYFLDTGDIANPRPVVRVPPEMGWPDGMTADADGMLWIALWGGAQVTRWDPRTGGLLAAYPLPALNVTSCCFGGADLTDLYVTSARKGMTAAQLAEYPRSGGLFRLRPDVRGMPTFVFGG
jgi:sugar lactone lactonase YvrE